jgi:hypothetical protein
MLPEVREYLEDVRSHLHLDTATERQIISELYSYFQEKVAELQDRGISEGDAIREAIKSFGRPRVLARLMYEAYSKGSWTEAVVSSLPHLIVAGLFISHLWRHPILAPISFASMVCVTLYGWWRGKPNWLYSWIGYSLLPLLIGGYASRPALEQTAAFILGRSGALPSIWILLLIGALFSFSLWIIIRTTIRVVRRDWVLASLMLVPLPILGSWLFNVEQLGSLFQASRLELYQWDALMASVLILLAAASAIFIRLRKRILKAGALIILGVIAGTIAGHILWGDPGFLGLLASAFLMLLFLLGPALLEAKIGHGELKGETWWSGEWVRHPSAIR